MLVFPFGFSFGTSEDNVLDVILVKGGGFILIETNGTSLG